MSSASAAGVSASHTTARLRVPETACVVRWPLRDSGWRVALAGLAMAAVGSAAGVVSGSPLMGTLCFAALIVSSWRLWLPVTLELGTKGLTQSTLVFRWRIPWRCFARYEKRSSGVWLLTAAERTPFSTLRGVYIPWSDQEAQILAVLEFFIAARRPRVPNSTRTFVS